MLRHIIMSTFALGALGCGAEDGPVDPAPDAGPIPGADAGVNPSMSVEIGTGSDRFVPVEMGDVLPLEVGPQGGGRFEGYHIFAAMKVEGYDPQRILADFQILDENRQVVAEQARRFPRLQPEGEAFVAFAVAPRIMDCCAIEGRPVYLRVEVEDQGGRTGSDERLVQAGPICEDQDAPGRSVCR